MQCPQLDHPGGPVAWKLSVISAIWGILAYMYTKAVVWATSATPLPMWDPEGSGMVPVPNMVADFRDTKYTSMR